MEKPLFSIILLHYNQPDYVKDALDSIFSQTYENIELVFADDASSDIDVEGIKRHIEKKKQRNINKIVWQLNDTNLGTVKTLNKAIQQCTGKYLLFFAADDKLYDKDVVTNFFNSFMKADSDVYMISSQCHLMDIKMKKKQKDFVNLSSSKLFNKFDARAQFGVFIKTCFLAIGATAMKMEMFEKYGRFNEKYVYTEDWSYFLHLTRLGGRIQYCNFVGLLHRDGGISTYDNPLLVPPHVLQYKLDVIRMHENEVLPYISDFEAHDIITVINCYETCKTDYILSGGDTSQVSRFMVLRYLPLFFVKNLVWKLDRNFFRYVKNIFDIVTSFCVFALLTGFFSYKFPQLVFLEIFLYALSVIVGILGLAIILMLCFKILYRTWILIKKTGK
jgi:Predicted glycosyltransferases